MTPPRLTGHLLGAVAAGGAVGAVGRWTLDELVPDGGGFPWTTFAINVVGSLLLAAAPALPTVRRRPLLAVAVGPGVLGGFTTLSAYAEQARALADGGDLLLAATYVAATLAACVLAVHLAQRLTSPAARTAFEDEEGNE